MYYTQTTKKEYIPKNGRELNCLRAGQLISVLKALFTCQVYTNQNYNSIAPVNIRTFFKHTLQLVSLFESRLFRTVLSVKVWSELPTFRTLNRPSSTPLKV